MMHPSAGKVPSAHIDAHVLSPSLVYGPAYGSVAFLLVEVETFRVLSGITSAEIYFDEVKLQALEEKVGILLIVSVKTNASPLLVFVPKVSTRVASSV